MKIVLIDGYSDFDKTCLSEDITVKKINFKELTEFNNNEDVIAVVGSRALAIATEKLNLPSLKLVQLTSAGFDGVPLEAFASRGVAVANVGGIYSVPIAETVIFGILQMAKRLRKNPCNRRFKLLRHYDKITELYNKKFLVMGAGNIGTAVADRLKGFETEIDAYDPYCPEKDVFKKILRSKNELAKSISEYDFIVSTMPDTQETKGFIDKFLFEKMKSSAVIINVGRKAVFNNNDFYYALKKRQIGGAVLDMFEKLPNPVTNKFRRLKNVVILPGVAAISKEVKLRLRAKITDNITKLLKEETLENIINGVK